MSTIDRTYPKVVNGKKFREELSAVFNDLDYLHVKPTETYILFKNIKQESQWDEVQNLIDNHENISLDDIKRRKNGDIDLRSDQLFSQGHTFDSKQFSLSAPAQRNWIGIPTSFNGNLNVTLRNDTNLTHAQGYDAVESTLFPMPVTTIDDQEYSFTSFSQFMDFYNGALTTVKTIYDSGRALKLQVNAATSIAEVEAVIDNR